MIEFESVGKTHPDGAVAIESFTYTVPKRRTAVLVGSSGSGKTMLLRMVNRMADPASGRVFVDGVDVREADPVKLRRSIGYMLQDGGLPPHRTVVDNVAIVPILNGTPRREAQSTALGLLERMGLDPELGARYPAQLSGGRRQCVGVTRALAIEPEILFMGEPFGTVDPIVRHELQDELVRLQGEIGKTVVFVTHDVEEAFRLCGEAVVLGEGGKIAQNGTPEGILAAPANDFVRTFVDGTKSNQTLRVRQVVGHSVTIGEDGRQVGVIEGLDGLVGGKGARDDGAREQSSRGREAQPRLLHTLETARSSLRKVKARWRLGGKSGDPAEGGPM